MATSRGPRPLGLPARRVAPTRRHIRHAYSDELLPASRPPNIESLGHRPGSDPHVGRLLAAVAGLGGSISNALADTRSLVCAGAGERRRGVGTLKLPSAGALKRKSWFVCKPRRVPSVRSERIERLPADAAGEERERER